MSVTDNLDAIVSFDLGRELSLTLLGIQGRKQPYPSDYGSKAGALNTVSLLLVNTSAFMYSGSHSPNATALIKFKVY